MSENVKHSAEAIELDASRGKYFQDIVPDSSECPACGHLLAGVGQRWYCIPCRTIYAQKLIAISPFTGEENVNAWARMLAHKAKRLGILSAKPCEGCGSADAEMHHEDYFRPLDIKWLCRSCHMQTHGNLSEAGLIAQLEMLRQGRRKKVDHGGALCSRCYADAPRLNQRYCRACHNQYIRDLRAKRRASQAKAGEG